MGEKVAYNTNLSRSRGKGFEAQVVKRLCALGYQAKKILLSGSHLAKPYDVIVKPYRLKIEAKRTMKNHITMQAKWLDKVSNKLILVFAVGKYGGKKSIEMFSLSFLPTPMGKATEVVGLVDSTKNMVKMRRSKKIPKEHMALVPFLVLYDERFYLVEKFEDYMEKHYSLNKKGEEVTTGVGPTEYGFTTTAGTKPVCN